MTEVSFGKAYPLGSSCDETGVNFALFSANAEKVELCLFNSTGTKEIKRYPIEVNDNNIWHIHIKGLKAGQVYGYRVYGPYKPSEGKRFNPHKLLLDPYAKKLVGKLIWHKALFAYDVNSPEKDLSFSTLDSAPYVPKSVVVEDTFDWENDRHPEIPDSQVVIYETHIGGYTKLHPKVLDSQRGKFLGMTSKSVINYLNWLGVTSVELLPVFAFFGNKDGMYIDNYWGYETLSYFIPEPKYMQHNDIDEFKQMVKTLHANGKEVILDVVYNHTIEGNQLGPTLCYRGIDNESYYTLQKENKRFYYDSTGCGASFNLQNPYVLTLVMDSLRYWVETMHVDGFRLDLATSLSRVREKFTQDSGFLIAARQDEILRRVKMIAEPWDATADGYRIGAYPPKWREWNDRYRDVIRRFWCGHDKQIGEFASRISGSSDIFGYSNRDIYSSINFITSHDGFNLRDLVSYNAKHNTVNGENNRDGNDANWSWNSGAEGMTQSADIHKLRLLRLRAMLATLLMSFGTPMLVAGDEFGNTQFGNNNPYCQDNVLTWIVWEAINSEDRNLARFVKKLIAMRKKMPVFERTKFFTGEKYEKFERHTIKDLMWLKENGKELENSDWYDERRKSLACFAYAENCSYICIFNADDEAKQWELPEFCRRAVVKVALSSADTDACREYEINSKEKLSVPAWSVTILEITKPEK
ncbi:MAG: glycogen debranching protein GlgX [Alphaproteobacteria bacterium]|nr:glycogen debranching protein GlgX [Alphaproteobacteria bacterium]